MSSVIDSPTVLVFSSAVFGIIGSLFFATSLRARGTARFFWFCMPFVMALCSTALVVNPALLPGLWLIRLSSFCILLTHAFGWQAIRAVYQRPALPVPLLLPALLWLTFSATLEEAFGLTPFSCGLRSILYSLFNGLAAYELWRRREEDLDARSMLFNVFVIYAVIGIVRAPFCGVLPAPLGAQPSQAWALVIYDLLAVTEALLGAALGIALSRERDALAHYRLAIIDPLTGIFNRRALDIDLGKRPGWPMTGSSFALLLLDLDRFKSINDRFGHAVGDAVICVAANAVRAILQDTDKIYRLGGEEFLCILPKTSPQEAWTIAERMRKAVETAGQSVSGLPTYATTSIGLVVGPNDASSLAGLIAEADRALYRAKQTGRNRIAFADLPLAAPQPRHEPATAMRGGLGAERLTFSGLPRRAAP